MALKLRHESPYGKRRAGVGLALLATVLLARAAHGEYDDFKANQAQPACDVTATPYGTQKGTVSGIKAELAQACDGGDSALVFAGDDGHLRNPDDPRDAPTYFLHGSKALRPGDNVRVMHVGANACQIVGGTSVSMEAIEASMNHSQN